MTMDAPAFVQPVTEIVIVAAGRAKVDRRGDGREQQFDAPPGSFCICPAGVPVERLCVRSNGVELIHIYFRSPASTLSSWRYEGGLVDPLVSQIGFAIAQELRVESAGGDLLLDSLRQALAARVSHRQMQSVGSNQTRAPALDARRLARVVEYLRANVESAVTLANIAQVACLSPHHFLRLFKHAVGVTPYRYLGELRIQHAKRLLTTSDQSIDAIAYRLHFSDSANFSRAFRRHAGVSPTTYRRLATKATSVFAHQLI